MKLIEQFYRIFAPFDCVACGNEGDILCPDCSKLHLKSVPSRCYRCYRLVDSFTTCRGCHRSTPLSSVWFCTFYDSIPRKVIHALKFNFSRDAAKLIAQHMSEVLPPLPDGTILVHVPAASSHVRQRGFDQSALIARELARLLNLPHVHALARIGQQRQVGAAGATRREQMKDAFRVISPSTVSDSSILLVDDVLTTGSTVESAALEIKKCGAKTVSAVCYAQAK